MLRGSCPEALSGFVKFHPQYPVLKVPGGACGPPCASRSRLARRCILRTSPPRVKGKFGFGRNYSGARADSAESSAFPQVAQSLPTGPCRPSLWRSLHNRGSGAMRESSERSSPRAMSATRPRAIRTPLLAPLQKQPFPPTRIGHSRHHMPANRAIAFSPIRPPPADLRSIRADRGLSEGAGRGRQHDRGAEHVRGIGHKAQLQRHSEAVPPRQAHDGGVLEGRRLREPDGALPPRSTGPPRDGRSASSAASSRDRRPFAVDSPMRPGKAPIAGRASRPGGKADSGCFPHKKWAPARANAQNRTRFSSHRPQWARPPRRGHARAGEAPPGIKKRGPPSPAGPSGIRGGA